MAKIDLDKMLANIKATQWSQAGIDWDALAAERMTEEPWHGHPEMALIKRWGCW